MDRRKFMKLSGVGLAGAAVLTSANAQTRPTGKSPDVIVVGAGSFGVWTAYQLRKKGVNVTLLDAYGPGNSRSSSGGETRQIQADRANPVYIKSAIYSYQQWKEVEEASKTTLLLPTGKLAMSTTEGLREGANALKARLDNFGIRNTEILEQSEIKYRWPQMYSDDLVFGVYHDGNASGSTLMARRGCEVVASEFQKMGGTMKIARCLPEYAANGQIDGIKLQDGTVMKADHYVFACGPWLPKLFPELLADKLTVQRRDVLFYGLPSGDPRFAYPNFPDWSISGSGYYGFPDIEGRGFKVAPYPDDNTIDPDNDERLVMPQQVKRGRDFLKYRFPTLGNSPITESRVCQVTNTGDFNFIIDEHPEIQNLWIAGGGSGHGFKHGPNIGQYLARRILGEEVDNNAIETFKLS